MPTRRCVGRRKRVYKKDGWAYGKAESNVEKFVGFFFFFFFFFFYHVCVRTKCTHFVFKRVDSNLNSVI